MQRSDELWDSAAAASLLLPHAQARETIVLRSVQLAEIVDSGRSSPLEDARAPPLPDASWLEDPPPPVPAAPPVRGYLIEPLAALGSLPGHREIPKAPLGSGKQQWKAAEGPAEAHPK